MNELCHHPNWPPELPKHLTLPETNMSYNAEVAAARFPNKPHHGLLRHAGDLRRVQGRGGTDRGMSRSMSGRVKAGDRVFLYMQNSPQWIIAYYGILRANAVVVPVNPMNLTEELADFVNDSGARRPSCRNAVRERRAADRQGTGQGIEHVIVATYRDYLKRPSPINVPEFVAGAAPDVSIIPGVTPWLQGCWNCGSHQPLTTGPDDLCVMPYTSGTTGKPKGCMHTHRSVMSTLLGGCVWFSAL